MPALEKGRVSFKEKKVIFIRLFSGYLAQVAPFAFLVFYASTGQLRFPARKLAVMTAALICGLAAAFAGAGVYLRRLFPPDLTLFSVVNLVFCASLLPCLIFYLAAVNAPWQKKLFVLSFTMTGAALASTIGNTIVENISLPGPPDGLPYRGFGLTSQLVCAVVIAILLFFVIKYFYLPVSARISPAENTYLSLLSVALMCVLVIGFTTNEFDILYKTSLFLYISLIVTVLVIYVVIFKIIAVSQEKLAVQQEVDQARSLLALQEEQYRRISDNKMSCSANMLAITMDNGFGGSVKVEGGHYITTKGQHLGIGLQSVTAIAEKYSGFAEFSHEEDVFHSSVMLHLPAVKMDMEAAAF